MTKERVERPRGAVDAVTTDVELCSFAVRLHRQRSEHSGRPAPGDVGLPWRLLHSPVRGAERCRHDFTPHRQGGRERAPLSLSSL
jgi:hypothetical protein